MKKIPYDQKRPVEERICIQCGRSFIISKSDQGIVCSYECRDEQTGRSEQGFIDKLDRTKIDEAENRGRDIGFKEGAHAVSETIFQAIERGCSLREIKNWLIIRLIPWTKHSPFGSPLPRLICDEDRKHLE